MTDPFAMYQAGLESPAVHLNDVVPNDTADLDVTSRALNVAVSGNVRVTTLGGETATVYIAAGSAFPVRATRIWATGTNAAGIVVMY